MLNDILKLSKQFISIQSIASNTAACNKILMDALKQLKEYKIEVFNKNSVKSALIYNSATRPKKFKIVLNGHLDIIQGPNNQYIPKIRGNKLYGTGSMDMKSNVACLIFAFKMIARKVNYPVALQIVTDEQTGGNYGTKYQLEKGVRSEFVIAGETSNFNIVNEAKGLYWLKITHTGKTAHGAYPWKGKNSIVEIDTFINTLLKLFPNPSHETWKTTINVSRIQTSNTALNRIPDDCTVWLDTRYIPKDKERVMALIKKNLPRSCTVETLLEEPPIFVEKENKYIKKLESCAHHVLKKNISFHRANGTSDATHYAKIHCPGVEFGPIGEKGEAENEWVDIQSLKKYYHILTRFLLHVN